jgi:hypothetical protein
MRRVCTSTLTILITSLAITLSSQQLTLPNAKDSIKFAVIGDTGTGGSGQQRIAKQLASARGSFPFTFAVMLGDNMYGTERPNDFANKFERPYKPLLDAGVTFHAALGNHDDPNQRYYKLFNMNGERYYSFKPSIKSNVRFFALDSNYVDKAQLDWVEKELSASTSDWKICFFHHPLYSSGEKHGSDEALRGQLEPLFLKHGVDLVLTGHEHFYERLKPQKGIHYIIAGSSAKLRKGNIGTSEMSAKGFDTGYAFMLMEIVDNQLHFQTIDENGRTVDSGVITRGADKKTTAR